MVVSTETMRQQSPTSRKKKRILSGIQPSGVPTLGNYLGAIRHWVVQQHEAESFHPIVNLHAMTLPYDPADLRRRTMDVAAALLACGIDPEVAVLFVQSEIPEHTELTWILSTQTMFGELSRMTQFKDKSRGQSAERIGAGLFFYPVLMASDILIYDADLVPVGDDQRQHVELTRDIAKRFNATFGETFVIPEADIKEEGARIMGLDDPSAKMSKSAASEYNYIALSDDPDTIRRKVRRAVTDSGSEVKAGPDKPALTNLLTIYAQVTDSSVAAIEEQFAGKGYGDFKNALADVLVDRLKPIQERLAEYQADQAELQRILTIGTDRAREITIPKLKHVRDVTGLSL
ncbi:MAG: tryptophan--tRNA ligase [Chloroflexota bacterium]